LVYPARRPKNFSELAVISKLFDVVEINSTYYHPQSASASEQWLAQVEANPRFRFTARIWQKLVLEKFSASGTGYSQTDIALAKRGMQPLLEAGCLGVLLAAFPQSFHYINENHDRLFRLLEAFQEYPLVVEVRHQSWHRPEVLIELNRRGVGFANIDQPQIGQALGFTAVTTGRLAYFRFHGRNQQQWLNKDAGVDERYDYLYSPTELESFVAPIQTALRQAESAYVIFNNHPSAKAVANALQLQFELTGTKVNVPEKLLRTYPDLARLRLGANPQQADLF
jgi:uncharacterized protein YecE (DUF72 family)